MTDVHQVLARFLAREPEVPFDLHDELRVIIAAARAHADFLDGFPTDEDVEIAKSEFGSEFIKQLGWGESKPFAALEVYAIAREAARAALQAVADARRTEEET